MKKNIVSEQPRKIIILEKWSSCQDELRISLDDRSTRLNVVVFFFFLFFLDKTYSLEASSSEFPQHIFLWRREKSISTFWLTQKGNWQTVQTQDQAQQNAASDLNLNCLL